MTEAADEKPPGRPPRVLLLYYTYTGQSQKVLEAAAEVFRARGCEVTSAPPIEFTDPRYAERFSRFPMRSVWPEFLGMLPAQTLQKTGDIRTPPDAVRTGGLRPDLHRLTHLVGHGVDAAAVVPEVPRGAEPAGRQAFRGVRGVPTQMAEEPGRGGFASSPRRRAAGTSTASTSPTRAASCPRCCR